MRHHKLIIIGAGISGLGVAQQASKASLAPLLLEAKSIAAATSNNTLRIIHGGFRYLQQLNLPRVIRSLNDQSEIFNRYRDCVAPLPCLMPLAARGLKSKPFVTIAAHTYGAIMRAGRSPLPTPRILNPSAIQQIAPELAQHTPNGALEWHDVLMTAPLQLAQALAQEITQNGGEIREQSPVAAISTHPLGYQISLTSGEHLTCERVINTLGPWLDTIQIPQSIKGHRPKWCIGFNIIIRRQIHPTHAIALQSPDGRLFFCVPRGAETAIGTWYSPSTQATEVVPPRPSETEIEAFIKSFNTAYYGQAITANEITSIDCGTLPTRGDCSTGPILLGQELLHNHAGYCEVISTKYTTFRSQAVRALRAL